MRTEKYLEKLLLCARQDVAGWDPDVSQFCSYLHCVSITINAASFFPAHTWSNRLAVTEETWKPPEI